MRDISATLLSAQKFEQTIGGKTGKRIPYVGLEFHSKDDTLEPIDYSDRHRGIEHHEMIYNGYATILLRNDDHLVEDLIGWWVEIEYGDYFFDDDKVITGHGSKRTARLWVESQNDISFPGAKFIVLELHDIWKLLDKPLIIEYVNDLAPYHYAEIENATPWELLIMTLIPAGFGLTAEGDDGIIYDLRLSKFIINGHYWGIVAGTTSVSEDYKGKYESFKDIILRVLSYTYSYIRAGAVEVDVPVLTLVYPPPAKGEREPDETYYSYKAPWFNEFVYRENIVSPNKVYTYCDYNFDEGVFNEPLLVGIAQDEDSIEKYAQSDGTVKYIEWCPGITDQENADSVAQAILSRQIIASRGGRLIIPHDIRVEIFDLVEVYDTR